MPRKLPFWLIVTLCFTLFLTFLFREFIFDSSLIMLNQDQLNGLGAKFFRGQHFILPQWDDSRLGGLPTLDAMYGDAYHPLAILQGIMDPFRAVGFKFILTVLIAFISGYVLFSHLAKNKKAGALIAFLFAMNPQFFSHIYGGHDGKMMVISIAPLCIWAFLKLREKITFYATFWLVFSISWMLLTSHLQLSYFFLWGLCFFSLFENFLNSATAESLKQKITKQSLVGVALLIGLAISAFQVFPPYEYTTNHSVRGAEEQTSFGHAVSWSLHKEELVSIFQPGFISGNENYWGHNSFKLNHDTPGVVLLALGFLGLGISGRKKLIAFSAIAVTIVLSYALGGNSPLFQVYYSLLPGVQNFRAPAMVVFWLPLIAGIMAAPIFHPDRKEEWKEMAPFGIFYLSIMLIAIFSRFAWNLVLDGLGFLLVLALAYVFAGIFYLRHTGEEFSLSGINRAWKSFFPKLRVVTVLTLVPFLWLLSVFFPGSSILDTMEVARYFKPINQNLFSSSLTNSIFLMLVFFALAAGTIWMLRAKHISTQVLLILLALGTVDTMMINAEYIQNIPESSYVRPEHPIRKALENQRKADPLNDYRILSLTRDPAASGNIFPLWQMRNAMGFHDNELDSYRTFRGGRQSSNFFSSGASNPFLDLMNIGYIIQDTPEGTRIFGNPTALPRVKVYQAVQTLPREDIIPKLQSEWKGYRDTLLLEQGSEQNPFGTTVATKAKTSAKIIESPTPDRFIIEAESPSPAWVLFTGNWHPFWKAKVNGEDVKVSRAFYTLRAIPIPSGKSKIQLYYQSDTISRSMILFWIGIILLGILLALVVWEKIKGKKSGEI